MMERCWSCGEPREGEDNCPQCGAAAKQPEVPKVEKTVEKVEKTTILSFLGKKKKK